MRQWRKANRATLREYNRQWRASNRERVRDMDRRWREAQGKAWKRYKRAYDDKNKAVINANRRRRYHERIKLQPRSVQLRLREALRARIRCSLKRRKASARTIALLRCSISDLMLYLESRFMPGMTWENYGSVWEMDHIMPCALFDLTKPEHQRACFHFSNLQPLFVAQNRKKQGRATTDQFNLL